MARRTYIGGKFRDILGSGDNLYYIEKGKKKKYVVSSAAKSAAKRIKK